ncbi:Ig-like domain-containing protein [Pontibacter locisalis]
MATHIVGGEFELQHLSGYNYRLYFNLYFDQVNGLPGAKDPFVDVNIFEKGTDKLIKTIRLNRKSETNLNYTNVGCTTSDLKTSKLVYFEDIYLDPSIYTSPAGYYMVWERCCRNGTITNIVTPGESGTTFYMEFPAVVKNGTFFKNSSPKLPAPPSDYACVDELFYYNFKSTDSDGDELVYDLVDPLNGHSSPSSIIPPPISAPYPEINWLPGHSKDNQIQGNPALNIDSQTGRLTVNPGFVGLYVFGVRCQEFRNGVKIGEVRRDFQLLVKACSKNESPEISAKLTDNTTPYVKGQVLKIGGTDSRCIKVYFTDPDKDEPLTLTAVPVNFSNNFFSLSGTTSGVVNTVTGERVLEASLCLDKCFSTNGEVYLLDLIVSDNGDNGCGLPKQDTLRVSLQVEPLPDQPPVISLSPNKRVITVEAGDIINFDVLGFDPDNEEVTLSAVGKNFDLNTQNITFETRTGVGQVTSPFTWQIDCKAINEPSYQIEFTATSSCGEDIKSTTIVEIRTRRYDIVNNVATAEQSICSGQTPISLTGSMPSGGKVAYTYTWEASTTSSTSGFTAAPGINNTQHHTSPALTRTTWFRRKVTSGLCSESLSEAVKVTVYEKVDNNTVSGTQTICINTAPALLTGSAPNGGSGNYGYLWEYSQESESTGFQPASGVNNEQSYQPGSLSQTTWYRRVVSSSPCESLPSQAVKITVVPSVTQNTISGNQLVCYGKAPAPLKGTLPMGGTGSFTYRWEYSTESATTGFSPAPGVNTSVDYTAPPLFRSTWYRRVVTSTPCESISNAVFVTVDPLPDPPTATGSIICPDETATLKASSPAASYILEWYDQATGGTLLHTGDTYTTPSLQVTTHYFVQTVNKNGCSSSERIKVTATVMPPTADAGPDRTIIQGNYVELRAKGGLTYSWSPTTSLSTPNAQNSVARPQETTTYTVTVTSEYGCIYTDEVIITVLPRIEPTNALTLNGDNINDTWHIRNIEYYPNCRVQVFTRWGAQIYDSKGYQEPWNGTHNGKPLPMAAYYYIIDLGMGEEPTAGSITLIK